MIKKFLDMKSNQLPPKVKHQLILFGLIKKNQLNEEEKKLYFNPFYDKSRQKIVNEKLNKN